MMLSFQERAKLSFNIELSITADLKRTLVSNIGRAILKKLAVKFKGNEITSREKECYKTRHHL